MQVIKFFGQREIAIQEEIITIKALENGDLIELDRPKNQIEL